MTLHDDLTRTAALLTAGWPIRNLSRAKRAQEQEQQIMSYVNIEGLDRAEIISALYNASQPLGMGFLHYDPAPMARDEAQALIDAQGDFPYFDYLKGRVMKVGFNGKSNEMRVDLYDRDNGAGAAARVIDGLRKKAA